MIHAKGISAAAMLCLFFLPLSATPVKNVILMIPDGTSTSVLSLARWCQWYKNKAQKALAVDPHIRGLVSTHSSNAPIGDSAPTSSWYATGEPSQTGFIAMSPPTDPDDLVPVDPARAYQPLCTVLEGARLAGKKTGLVVTCQFPHATPADFAAHWYDRQEYDVLAQQMAHNGIDLLFGGGVKYCTPDLRAALARQGYAVLLDDLKRFRALDGRKTPKIWALFGESDLPYDLDRDQKTTPSLAEMTGKAIGMLSRHDAGFFLMVEGSKIDWAGHANDPVGIYSEFLAFDRAVDTAMRFARTDSHTVVVVCPDHGNSAVSIGNRFSDEGYDNLTLKDICAPVAGCKLTAEGIADRLIRGFRPDSAHIQSRFSLGAPGIALSSPEMHAIARAYGKIRKSKSKDRDDLRKTVAGIIASRSFIGFSTHGHTGEDVFFAAYDPRAVAPSGVIDGGEVNRYLCDALGMARADGTSGLQDSTSRYFAKYTPDLKDMYLRQDADTIALWDADSLSFCKKIPDRRDSAFAGIGKGDIVLRVAKKGRAYAIPAYRNYYYAGTEQKSLATVTVWVDKNRTFYLPREVVELLR